MKRINNADLEGLANRINIKTGNCPVAWSHGEANVGNYHISGAYGGVSLHQMANTSGGIHEVFGCGHVPKRDLYNRMHTFLLGLEVKR